VYLNQVDFNLDPAQIHNWAAELNGNNHVPSLEFVSMVGPAVKQLVDLRGNRRRKGESGLLGFVVWLV
jgi:hypothetical protein